MNQHEEFLRAYAEYPSQDNEGYQPDRAGFKAGFGAAWEIQQRRVAQLEEALRGLVAAYPRATGGRTLPMSLIEPYDIACNALDGRDEKGKGVP